MKKYILCMSAPVILGCAVLFFPRPHQREASRQPVEQRPYHEEVISTLWRLAKEDDHCLNVLSEANRDLAKDLLFGQAKQCLTCQALALLTIRSADDGWYDTIGEYPFADDLDCCAVQVIRDAEHDYSESHE